MTPSPAQAAELFRNSDADSSPWVKSGKVLAAERDKMIDAAQFAMDCYHAAVRDGEEPEYPQWAFDFLKGE